MNYEHDSEEGINTGVSDDAFEQDPVLAKYQTEAEQEHWLKELAAARKERRAFTNTAAKTIERYSDERAEDEKSHSHANVFFEVTDLKMAALYARTPEPDIKRRFNDAADDVSRVAAMLLHRSISYELECGGFDQRIKQILFDRLVPGIGIGWARLEHEEQEGPITFDAATGLEVPSQPVVTNQFAEIDYVAWDDFISAPCQVWSLCPWIGRRIPMSKPAVLERFGTTAPTDVLEGLSFAKASDVKGTDDRANQLKPKNSTEATVDVYELWDKERRLVFWIVEGADTPLDVQGDRNEFPDFYPTPLPPLGRFSTSNTTPISDYKLVQDLYNELDDLNNRCARLVRAIKLVFVYDASNEALKDLFTTTEELEGVPVKDWAIQMSEKGGLKGAIEFSPLNDIVAAYEQLITARDRVKAQIYEIEGISDLMRAQTDRYTSAEATATASQFGMSRLSVQQRDVAEYIAALLRLKAHLICKFYTPEFIVKRAGMLPAADQQLVGPALQLLKDAQLNHFRLNVSTDAIQLPNWNQEKADKTAAVQALSNLLPQLVQAAEKVPAMGAFGAQTVKWLISGFKGSEEIEGFLDAALKQMEQDQQKKAGEKKPTPEELAMQEKQAELQMEMQKQQLKGQIDVQVAQIQAQSKVEAARLQAEVDAGRNQIKAMEAQMDARFRALELQLEATRTAHQSASDIVTLGGS